MEIDDCVVPEISSSSAVKKIEENVTSDIGNSTSAADSDMSFHDEEEFEDNCEDGGSEYYDNDDYDDDYMYAEDDDKYTKMQSQFDNVDLPPGVEISLPWMEAAASKTVQSASSSSLPSVKEHSGATTTTAQVQKMEVATASSSTLAEAGNPEEAARERYEGFKRFDTVEEFTDHHYTDVGLAKMQNPDKKWVKKVQEEWNVLEQNLPDTIYVRVSEKRMDLLRAVIIGPAGTPYHDGLFTFDAVFPHEYPAVPPMVFYYSGGLRLNPNLYDCGKVCLSLLHTWSGKQTEMWIPGKSTMLQVLVSIQGLILNANPFFNEPGYEKSYRGAEGEKRSRKYNNDVYILSLKTMMYTLRRPPLHFEDLVVGHFRVRAHDIMAACKAYMEGVIVGSALNGEGEKGKCSIEFKQGVTQMMIVLIKLFTSNGSKDLEQFLPTACMSQSLTMHMKGR
uniref:E2 ubiquitin-conjugating enzyme n=1 Tax=Kalanchoe fedtschenkoi TaxID=63787 RepID=A0A7N0TJH8_KALFE